MKRLALSVGPILIVAAGALAFRLPRLDQRPVHTDEAVHTVRFADFWLRGAYDYDVHDFHGPTLYYFTLPVVWLSGARDFAATTELTYRIVPVVFGLGLVLLAWGIGDGLGRPAAVCAGILTAVSPAMVFYSRYYIMETLLVFFTFGAMVAGWRYVRTRRPAWAILAGACLGLMHATKETCVIAYAAMLFALTTAILWERWVCGKRGIVRPFLRGRVLVASVAAGAIVSVLLFSLGLRNWTNVLDSIRTYASYLDRSGGAGFHRHPWWFYLKMLAYDQFGTGPAWSEGFILGLAAVGAVAAMVRKEAPGISLPLARFLVFYTAFMTVAYSAIPYKTPWCLLGFLHGMILLAGVGAAAIIRWAPGVALKAVVCVALAAGGGHLAWQAYRGSYQYEADIHNPYVYAHTSKDLLRLVSTVEEIALADPDRAGHNMVIKVVSPDSDVWPLPWYFRHFRYVGYYTAPPKELNAPVVIAPPEVERALMERMDRAYAPADDFYLRPGVPLRLYVWFSLWQAVEYERARVQGSAAATRASP